MMITGFKANEVVWWPYMNTDGRPRFMLFGGPADFSAPHKRFLTKRHAFAYAAKRGWTVR